MQLINLTTIVATLALVGAQEHYQNVKQACQTMGFCIPTNPDTTQCYNCQLDLSTKNQVYNQANRFAQGQSGYIDPQSPPSPVAPTQVPTSGSQPSPTTSDSNNQSKATQSSNSVSKQNGSTTSGKNGNSSNTTTQGNNANMIGGSLILGTFSLIASIFI